MRNTNEAMLKAVDYLIRSLARYRRMVETAPEMHEGMTIEEFDNYLNEKCEMYHEKYSSMDTLEVILDGLTDSHSKAVNRLNDIFKGGEN